MARIPLDQASREQLKAACDLLGLASDGRTSAGKLLSLIEQSGYDKDYIELEDALTPRPTARVSLYEDDPQADLTEEDRKARDARKVAITVAPTDGQSEIYVGVNGALMKIPTGRRVVIPWPYFHALENARVESYAESEEGLGEASSNTAYQFTFHGFVKEQVAA